MKRLRWLMTAPSLAGLVTSSLLLAGVGTAVAARTYPVVANANTVAQHEIASSVTLARDGQLAARAFVRQQRAEAARDRRQEARLDAAQAAAAAALAAQRAAARAAREAQTDIVPSTASTSVPPPSQVQVGGGILSYAQLEQVWVSAGGPSWAEAAAASVAECESGGNPNAYNPSGASGLWQILGQVVAGNIFAPVINGENAVAKFDASGQTWAQWVCQP